MRKEENQGWKENPALVSVIIPVYDTEPYLPGCLDSVLNQTYANMEVLCVDDCSLDRSYEILQHYQAQDPRVFVFRNHRNQGASGARNEALKHIRGKYVWFVDSDDTMEPGFLEFLVEKISVTNADAVVTRSLLMVSANGTRLFASPAFSKVPSDVLIDAKAYCADIPVFLYTKIFRSDIIRAHDLTFSTSLSTAEDNLFHYEYFAWADKVLVSSGPYYHYHRRRDSLTSDYAEVIKNSCLSCDAIYDYYEKEKLLDNQINLCGHLAFFLIETPELYDRYKRCFSKLVNHMNMYPDAYLKKEHDIVKALLASPDYEAFVKLPVYRVFKVFNAGIMKDNS